MAGRSPRTLFTTAAEVFTSSRKSRRPSSALRSSVTLRLLVFQRLEVLTVAGAETMRPDVARGVAARGGVLDLDDLGAERGQELRAVRRGAPGLDAQYAETLERPHETGFLLSHCFAMITRWISFVPSPITVSGASR